MFASEGDRMENKMEIETKVSIVCAAYNHEKYIAKALDGFLMQKTNFQYEIIVHDDASTDRTREILLEYQRKYPEKIKLLLQEENQYSKGVMIIPAIIFPKIKAKYIAICEGDDEWIYDEKLQKQFDFMEEHTDTMLCTHNAIRIDEHSNEKVIQIQDMETGYVSNEETLLCRKGRVPTASFFLRTSCVRKMPDFNLEAPVGDDPMRFSCAYEGKIYYFDKVWSVRNYMHEGSWNLKKNTDNIFYQNYLKKYLRYLDNYNNYTNYIFDEYIKGNQFYLCKTAVIRLIPEIEEINGDLLSRAVDICKDLLEHKYDGMFNVVYSIMLRECKDYWEYLMDWIKSGKERGNVFIYGAGQIATQNAKKLQDKLLSFDGFVVSYNSSQKMEHMGYYIYDVNNLPSKKEETFFWLCMNEKNIREVLPLLIEKGYYNIMI